MKVHSGRQCWTPSCWSIVQMLPARASMPEDCKLSSYPSNLLPHPLLSSVCYACCLRTTYNKQTSIIMWEDDVWKSGDGHCPPTRPTVGTCTCILDLLLVQHYSRPWQHTYTIYFDTSAIELFSPMHLAEYNFSYSQENLYSVQSDWSV